MKTSIAGDFHFNYVNHKLVEKWLTHLAKNKFDKVIINGDLLDSTRLAHFDLVPDWGDTFLEEVAYVKNFLNELRRVHKGAIQYVEGNHCMRLRIMLLKNAPMLYGFKDFTLPALLNLNKYDIEFIPVQEGASKFTDVYVEDQGFLVGHFNAVAPRSGGTARKLLDKYQQNIIQAHVHRGGIIYHTVLNKTLIGVEGFCMCNPNPFWAKLMDWQNGWVDLIDREPVLHHSPC